MFLLYSRDATEVGVDSVGTQLFYSVRYNTVVQPIVGADKPTRKDTATDLTAHWPIPVHSFLPTLGISTLPAAGGLNTIDTMQPGQPTATTHLPFNSFFRPLLKPQEVANLDADWTRHGSPLRLRPSSLSQLSRMTLPSQVPSLPPSLFSSGIFQVVVKRLSNAMCTTHHVSFCKHFSSRHLSPSRRRLC